MSPSNRAGDGPVKRKWITRGVVGIVLATFFSDVGHEMVTAVLPHYLSSVALGAAALGIMEGLADLLFSLSKLAGGWVGHHTQRKRAFGTLGYLLTTVGTGCIALVQSVTSLVALRASAWFGRGFRSPLRDFMLSDEVGPTHFGRAYGIERTADMVGAVIGPLLAAGLIWAGIDFRTVILISIIPSAISVLSFFSMTRDRESEDREAGSGARPKVSKKLPRRFWVFTGGVALFGFGDFSRTFLIFLAAAAFGETGVSTPGTISIAVLLYALHNFVSALAAYPAGILGDRREKSRILAFGYALGVITNIVLAFAFEQPVWLVVAIILSGIYFAIQETIEKATAAELLPRELRSWGLGVVAATNAVGTMAASFFVGIMIAKGHPMIAFGIPAVFGLAGTVWIVLFATSKETA